MKKPNVNAAGYARDLRVLAAYCIENPAYRDAALASRLAELAADYNLDADDIEADLASEMAQMRKEAEA